MPNQNNYRTDITTPPNTRYTVSRIISVPDVNTLTEEVPASFAFDKDDNIEIHFYTAFGNELILSDVVRLSDDIIKSHIVTYPDGTYKNYIRIDFTKFFIDKQLILIPGDYRMVLNFFSDEIGSYINRKLTIDVISDTRTEVQVSFNDTTDGLKVAENLYLLQEFVEKSFNKTDAVGVAEKIFASGVQLNDSTEGLTAENIEEVIPLTEQTLANTIDRIERIGLKDVFDETLNKFLLELYKILVEEIVINGDERIQETEFGDFIQRVVEKNIYLFAQQLDMRIQAS